MAAALRVGVVGGGLIAQTVHLPLLAAMSDRFQLTAIADPSERVRTALGARYGIAAFADWRQLISDRALDAIVVCSPQANHAEVTLAALDAGLHALVEKPLCIDVTDAEAICARREASGLVVQVGYMKRFDAAFEALLERLPATAAELRLIDVVTRDPGMARPPFLPRDFVRADDVPAALVRTTQEQERQQVEAAIGVGDPASVRAFNYTFLACLVHDVNLVHGALERLDFELPLAAVGASHWAGGEAASVSFRLPSGGVWNCSWLLLDRLEGFAEDARLYFRDQIHRIRFDVPYLRERPTLHEVRTAAGDGERVDRVEHLGDAYARQLEHFHACVVGGERCRTPPEQARLDLLALRAAFLTLDN